MKVKKSIAKSSFFKGFPECDVKSLKIKILRIKKKTGIRRIYIRPA